MLGFVQMRAAACQSETESLIKLYDDIKNDNCSSQQQNEGVPN
jgi:hypothetical protein